MKNEAVVAVGSWKDQKNGSSVVLSCSCSNAFQDKTYGKGNRVHNVGGKTGGKRARCTSCDTLR